MFKKVAPYIGEYKKYTIWAVIAMCIGIVASVMPYYFLYQIISPLTKGESISFQFVMLRVLAVGICEVIYSFSYVQGLTFSHISAYNTLKNLRVSLQGKLEKQSLGNIQNLGTGRIKKVFTDDIDMIELLLAHAIPEGIANIVVPVYAISSLFRKDCKWAIAGFPTDASEALINELEFETDTAKRAALANQIVQMTIDDNAFGYVGLFNKTTVMRVGVSDIAENCPFDFYRVDASTDKK